MLFERLALEIELIKVYRGTEKRGKRSAMFSKQTPSQIKPTRPCRLGSHFSSTSRRRLPPDLARPQTSLSICKVACKGRWEEGRSPFFFHLPMVPRASRSFPVAYSSHLANAKGLCGRQPPDPSRKLRFWYSGFEIYFVLISKTF